MATVFTQDSLLHFLQSRGGSVKNADLLQHFRNFLRDHAERNRNRELFKQFVNSVATVKQIDGVSHVVLRKKFRGHVPGGNERHSSVGDSTEPSQMNASPNLFLSIDKQRQRLQQKEETVLTGKTTILPATGIMQLDIGNMETNHSKREKAEK